MIRRVSVVNHQSLESMELELGRFTVIVGRTDSGKSSFLRAMRLVFANSSSVGGLVRAGAKSASVRVEFDDGTWVGVQRGPSLSTYTLDRGDGPEEFPKAGTSVPVEVSEFLRLPELAGRPIWWSTQHDPPFLLAETGSAVSQILGTVTAVDTVQAAARTAVTRGRRARALAASKRADLESAVENIRSYGDFRARRAVLAEARRLFDSAEALERRILAAAEAVEVAGIAGAALREAEAASLAEDSAAEALAEALAALERDWERMEAVRRAVEQAESLSLAEARMRREAEEERSAADALEAEYREVLVEAGECPVCGSEVR